MPGSARHTNASAYLFDKIYYESQTYLDGKAKVNEGLEKGIFYKRPDGSVWADLKDAGLDEKLLLAPMALLFT